ncbi:carboxyltransferase domain-containing protein, partial [Mycobacterium sp.]|uniref:carboxyltransferase domain-containing protein n=1 Tax=Mycobacterium sp. TaxID=1785 RepID=UPI003C765633
TMERISTRSVASPDSAPREAPGGWQLIGRTDATLWEIDRADPALLTPGMTVQFRESR